MVIAMAVAAAVLSADGLSPPPPFRPMAAPAAPAAAAAAADGGAVFRGVTAVLAGFTELTERQVAATIREHGGNVLSRYDTACSHVIVFNLALGDPICMAAKKDGKVLVTNRWLEDCLTAKMAITPGKVLYQPVKDIKGIPSASELVISLTGYQGKLRRDIMLLAEMMGATFSKQLHANRVTHLICCKFEGEKYNLAVKTGRIVIINHLWLEDCLRFWELLLPDNYCASGDDVLKTEAEAAQLVAGGSDRMPLDREDADAAKDTNNCEAAVGMAVEITRTAAGAAAVVDLDALTQPEDEPDEAVTTEQGEVESVPSVSVLEKHVDAGASTTRPCDPLFSTPSSTAAKQSTSTCQASAFKQAPRHQEALIGDRRNESDLLGARQVNHCIATGSVVDDKQVGRLRNIQSITSNLFSEKAEQERGRGGDQVNRQQQGSEAGCAQESAKQVGIPAPSKSAARSGRWRQVNRDDEWLVYTRDASETERALKAGVNSRDIGFGLASKNLGSRSEGDGAALWCSKDDRDTLSFRQAGDSLTGVQSMLHMPDAGSSKEEVVGSPVQPQAYHSAEGKLQGQEANIEDEVLHEPLERKGCNVGVNLGRKRCQSRSSSQDADQDTEGRAGDTSIHKLFAEDSAFVSAPQEGVNKGFPVNSPLSRRRHPTLKRRRPQLPGETLVVGHSDVGAHQASIDKADIDSSTVSEQSGEADNRVTATLSTSSHLHFSYIATRKARPDCGQPTKKDNLTSRSNAESRQGLEQEHIVSTSAEDKFCGSDTVGPDKALPDRLTCSLQQCVRWFALGGRSAIKSRYEGIIKKLGGKLCRDQQQWDERTTHVILPEPLRRTEKFFAGAAAGRWLLKPSYLDASLAANNFVAELDHEWFGDGANEDGSIQLAAARCWREQRQVSSCAAFQDLKAVVHGDLVSPPTGILVRGITAGNGVVVGTGPPFARAIAGGLDLAIIGPAISREDPWVIRLLDAGVGCVAPDFLVELIAKGGEIPVRLILFESRPAVEKALAKVGTRVAESIKSGAGPAACSSKQQLDVAGSEQASKPEVVGLLQATTKQGKRRSKSARASGSRRAAAAAAAAQAGDGHGEPGTCNDKNRAKVDSIACTKCHRTDDEDIMILCGDDRGRGCSLAVHIHCLTPPLKTVPQEDWFCSSCSTKAS
eukprot:SM000015S01271  [mRNA]  locus=s15:934093:940115:- [translate_table: standard]